MTAGTTLISTALLWDGNTLREDVVIEAGQGRVVAVHPAGYGRADAQVHLAMPGATDLQVNGGGGVLFNADPGRMGEIACAHRGLGTARILPTLITDRPEAMEAAVNALLNGLPQGIEGVHLEGPHLSPARRGTHEAAYLRPADDATLDQIARLRAAHIPVLVTLAPEIVPEDWIARALALGAVISAGHSSATAPEAEAGFDRGITMVTHLYNAMEPATSRAPNLLGAAIRSQAWLGMIADGIHVDWQMLAIAIAARPVAGRCFLVSDAMPTVGGPDTFTLYGNEIRVVDGRLVNAEGALAGAHLDMITALRGLHLHAGVPLADVIAMATDIPRRAMGLKPLRIMPGTALADIAVLDEDLMFGGWLDA